MSFAFWPMLKKFFLFLKTIFKKIQITHLQGPIIMIDIVMDNCLLRSAHFSLKSVVSNAKVIKYSLITLEIETTNFRLNKALGSNQSSLTISIIIIGT